MKKIMIILIIIAAIIITFVIIDGSFLPKRYNGKWSDHGLEQDEYDISKIVSYAIGAPSSHNMQPWLVKIDDNKIMLYADTSKTLPVVDKDNYQMLMSQGTFIQKLENGAREYGYSIDVEYTDIHLEEELPLIAEIMLTRINDVIVDTISSSTNIRDNETNTANFDILLDKTIEEYGGFSYEYISEDTEIKKLQNFLLQGTIAESMDTDATQELLDVFRWTEWQKNKYRYGLSLNSLPSILKPLVQPIMRFSSKNIESFGESSIKMFEDRLENEIAYILIKKDKPENVDYVYTGEIYQKLSKQAGGYVLRPAMQVLEDFEAMEEINSLFQKEYFYDGQVMIIIGIQPNTMKINTNNPRHLIQDIIIE